MSKYSFAEGLDVPKGAPVSNMAVGRTTARVDPIHVVHGEISVVVSHMRRNARWASLHGQGDEDPLLAVFKKLKNELHTAESIENLSVEALTAPFLEVVRCETTSGPITGVALSSIHKFLTYDVFARCPGKAEGVAKIGEAVTHTRFVFTDVDSDEVVLMKLLQVLQTLTVLPIGNLLTDEAVCEMIQAVFRISCRSRLSKLLRKSAENALFEMVVYLFGRLHDFLHLSKKHILGGKVACNHGNQLHCNGNGSGSSEGGEDGAQHDEDHPAASIRRKSNDLLNGSSSTDPMAPTPTEQSHTDLTLSLDTDTQSETDVRSTGISTVHMDAKSSTSTSTESMGAGTEGSNNGGSNNVEEKGTEESEMFKEQQSGASSPKKIELDRRMDSQGNIVLIETVDGVVVQKDSPADDHIDNLTEANSTTRVQLGEPYNLPCLRELFRFLTTLIDPKDPDNTDGMLRLGIQLLTVAVEVAGPLFPEFPTLLGLLSNEMCRYMCAVTSTGSLTLFTLAARLGLLTFQTLRIHIKFQQELFLDLLMKRVDDPRYSPEHTEAALEVLLQLCRDPQFVAELYLNYDSSLFCSNLLEKLVKFLSEHTFPSSGQLLSTHSLALDVLMETVAPLEARRARSLKGGTSVHNNSSTRPHGSAHVMHRNSSLSSLCDLAGGVNPALTQGESGTGNLFLMAQSMRHSKSWNSLGAHEGPVDDIPNAATLRRLRVSKKLLFDSAALFNKKPKTGIAFLHEHGIIPKENYEKDLVVYLRTTQQLDKAMIGDYIGRPDQTKILDQYTKEMNMKGKRIDESLRDFLEGFRLPGEAQIIFRIMEAFAKEYLANNPETSADEDATFVLAYAIIMLNVDQHNPRIKNRMSVDDFRKNQRGLNGGKDFAPDYLETIYNAIRDDEIIMPDEQEGAAYENYQWAQILSRSEKPMYGSYISANSRSDFDRDVFLIVWKPVIAAVKYIFDTATTDTLVQRAINGFQKSTTLAASYGLSEVVDKMVISLTNFTSLLASDDAAKGTGDRNSSALASGRVGGKDELPIRFGQNYKAQLAAVTVFSLAREQGDMLREGWTNVLECVRRLYLAKLLPEDMTIGRDYISPSGTSSLVFSPKIKEENKDNGLFGTISAFMFYSEPVEEEIDPKDIAAEEATQECIRLCRLPELFEHSGRLSDESLQYLASALVHESHSPYQRTNESHGSKAEGTRASDFNEGSACLFLEHIVKLCLHNLHRIEQIWPMIIEHLHSIILTPGKEVTPHLIKRATIGLLQLATACYKNTNVSHDVIRTLAVLLNLPAHVFKALALQIMRGLEAFIRINGSSVTHTREWDTILSLVATCAQVRVTQPRGEDSDKENATDTEKTVLLNSANMAVELLQTVVENHLSEASFMPSLRCANRCVLVSYPQVHTSAQAHTAQHQSPSTPKLKAQGPAQANAQAHGDANMHTYAQALSHTPQTPPATPGREENTSSTNLLSHKDNTDTSNLWTYKNMGMDVSNSDLRDVGQGKVNVNVERHRSNREKRRPQLDSAQAERTARLTGLLFAMCTQVPDVVQTANAKNELATTSLNEWDHFWKPLLCVLCEFCCHPAREVRTNAVTQLQRALCIPALTTMTHEQWESLFQEVLFPMLMAQLSPDLDRIDPVGVEESRLRTAGVLCKVVLQQSQILLEIPSFFTIWIRILEILGSYINANNSDYLRESVPEALKNMLLVMTTSGVLSNPNSSMFSDAAGPPRGVSSSQSEEFWRLTWVSVGKYLPSLRTELFPEEANAQPATTADLGPPPAAETIPQPQTASPGASPVMLGASDTNSQRGSPYTQHLQYAPQNTPASPVVLQYAPQNTPASPVVNYTPTQPHTVSEASVGDDSHTQAYTQAQAHQAQQAQQYDQFVQQQQQQQQQQQMQQQAYYTQRYEQQTQTQPQQQPQQQQQQQQQAQAHLMNQPQGDPQHLQPQQYKQHQQSPQQQLSTDIQSPAQHSASLAESLSQPQFSPQAQHYNTVSYDSNNSNDNNNNNNNNNNTPGGTPYAPTMEHTHADTPTPMHVHAPSPMNIGDYEQQQQQQQQQQYYPPNGAQQ